MKILIRVEKGKKFVEIPLAKKEVEKIYGVYLRKAFEDRKFDSVFKKLTFLMNDVIYDGKVYVLIEKDGKFIVKPLKERYYVIKKPKWKVRK